MVWVEINEKTAYIQARSFLARTLKINGKARQVEREAEIAGKGENSLQHYNLVHKFIPMPQALKIPAAKAAVDKELENWRTFRRGT